MKVYKYIDIQHGTFVYMSDHVILHHVKHISNLQG